MKALLVVVFNMLVHLFVRKYRVSKLLNDKTPILLQTGLYLFFVNLGPQVLFISIEIVLFEFLGHVCDIW